MIKNIKYIVNILNSKRICKYDVDNDSFSEIDSQEGLYLSKGIYSNIIDSNFKMAGIIESKDGALFFADDFRFIIKDINFEFHQSNLENLRAEFKLIVSDKEIVKIEYKKPLSDFDAWSREEDIDLFQWLLRFCENQEMKEKFFRIYKK